MRYGIIGNCNTAALVHENGAIEWCCFPRFDSPSVFAAIVDPDGGSFQVTSAGKATSRQTYVPGTAVLRTEFDDGENAFAVVDFMPRFHDGRAYQKPLELHRLIVPMRGRPTIRVLFNPRLDYARNTTALELHDGMVEASNALEDVFLYSSLDLRAILAGESMVVDEEHFLIVSYHEKLVPPDRAYAREMLARTTAHWEEWSGRCHLPSQWAQPVLRSAITLKLLTYEDTGAIVAAATTSLPETIHDVRNWDYRYCWLRDASLVLESLARLGHYEEMRGFVHFLLHLFESKQTKVQIAYRIDGGTDLAETTLDHLRGYRDTRPVRVGNAAFRTRQNDIFGEVLNTIHLYYFHYAFENMNEEMWSLVKFLVGTTARDWTAKDAGIWEFRHRPKHFTYSKILSWVAMDRGVDIATRLGRGALAAEWMPVAQAIRGNVLQRGYNRRLASFTQSYGSKALDVSLLRAAHYGFVDAADPRWISTVRACEQSLSRNGYVFRYTSKDDFGFPRSAFILASLWMAKALDTIGERDKALSYFENILARANHLGLLSEDVDVDSGELLGNFPQAYSHMAIINTAHQLSRSEPAPRGEI